MPVQFRSDFRIDQESLPYLAAPSSFELVVPGHCLRFVAFASPSSFRLAAPRASYERASSRPRYRHSCVTRDLRSVVRADVTMFPHLTQKPSIATPPARAVARHVALQHYLLVPMGSFCSGRSTPAHTVNSHTPPRACLRHSLGTAHKPLLCRCRARLLPHLRAWATPRVTAHSELLASARVSHLLRSHASCTPLLARGRSHPAYPCRNHTLPHRFSSARVPPRRELRPSAAWFACRSCISVTPPARAASTPVPARSCSRAPSAVHMLLLLRPSHSRACR
jgi:hypothetical protein